MSRLKPTLNEWMKRHEETCSCLKCCDCGQIDRVAEFAKLCDNYKASQDLLAIREEQVGELLEEKAERAALDEARKAFETAILDPDDGYDAAAAWLKKYPKV
jgi:hypothetical protein